VPPGPVKTRWVAAR